MKYQSANLNSASFNVKQIIFSIFFLFFFSNHIFAQELKLHSDFRSLSSNYPDLSAVRDYHFLEDTVKIDTTQDSSLSDLSSLSLAIKPKLLPDNMSFMEKFLWDEDGFMRKLGVAGPLTKESRESELKARRTMLTVHQISGLATLGLMLTADYFGQRVIDGHRSDGDIHQAFVGLTIGTYALTGMLAVLAPPPLIRREGERISTTGIHKTLAWVHFAGMILTPILGSLIENHHKLNIDKAHFHQISAYTTTAVFAASVIVLTF